MSQKSWFKMWEVGAEGRVRRVKVDWRTRERPCFICPCYPSEELKGGEVGAPFVPQESADGCNPFQNVQRKYIKTECKSVGAGDTFLWAGVPSKKTQVGSN